MSGALQKEALFWYHSVESNKISYVGKAEVLFIRGGFRDGWPLS